MEVWRELVLHGISGGVRGTRRRYEQERACLSKLAQSARPV